MWQEWYRRCTWVDYDQASQNTRSRRHARYPQRPDQAPGTRQRPRRAADRQRHGRSQRRLQRRWCGRRHPRCGHTDGHTRGGQSRKRQTRSRATLSGNHQAEKGHNQRSKTTASQTANGEIDQFTDAHPHRVEPTAAPWALACFPPNDLPTSDAVDARTSSAVAIWPGGQLLAAWR